MTGVIEAAAPVGELGMEKPPLQGGGLAASSRAFIRGR